jgi:hypothetical protein
MEKQADQPLLILAPSANGATAETQPPPELLPGKEGLLNNFNPYRYAEI